MTLSLSKRFPVGRAVFVSFGKRWLPATVTGVASSTRTVDVFVASLGHAVAIHESVLRKNLRVAPTLRRCRSCNEPEKTKGEVMGGGDFGWFDSPEGLVCLACGKHPARKEK